MSKKWEAVHNVLAGLLLPKPLGQALRPRKRSIALP